MNLPTDMTFGAASVAVLSFIGGIAVNLFTSGLYDQLVGKISFRQREYPDLVGEWNVDVELEGVPPFAETVTVSGQVNRRFKGSYTSPAIGKQHGKGVVDLDIEGYLLDHRTVRYVAQSKRNRHVDYVTGLALISNDRQTITGLSVSMGVLTEEPTVARVVFTRVR